MDKMIAMWCGKRVDELTREELIEAVTVLARQLHDQRESHRRSWDLMRDISKARAARSRGLFDFLSGAP